MTEKRKRAAPTIDLKATEVPGSQAASAASAPEPPKPAPAPPQQDRQAPPEQAPAAAPPPHDFIKTIVMPLAAGFAGAMLGGAVIWGLSPRAANDGAQIAALRKQIEALQNQPAAAVPDSKAVEALRERLGKIERDVANLPPGDAAVADRLAAADSAMKSLGVALTALNKRNDDAAANAKQADERAAAAEKAVAELRDSVQSARQQASNAVDAGQLAAVQQRLAALEQAMKDAHDRITAQSSADKAARLALSAAALRDAVERGAPYQAELAQARALGADEAALAALAAFAASGVPGRQALAHALGDLVPALAKAAGIDEAPSGFIERLQANASKLVRISPVNAPPGDRAADVLARLEVEAAHGDIAAALADIGKLPETARQQAADWVSKAAAREAALAAARKFAADTARGLAQ